MTASVDLHARPTALYQFFDRSGSALYFGISVDPEQRWQDHVLAHWWKDVDPERTTVTWLPDRNAALAAEAEAIRVGRPAHNRQHAFYRVPPGVPVKEARRRLADLLHDAAGGKVTYITSRGRRIAAVVPVAVADDVVEESAIEPPPS